MEDSGYNSLMIGVYIFIFLIATSLTVYLFSTTVTVADNAFEYGKVTTGDSVIETTSAPQYSIITGAELLTYYYNYKSPDKYGSTNTVNYDFSNINNVGIDINKSYALIYDTANTGAKPVIIVKDITSEVGAPSAGEVIPVNNQPSDPVLVTYPGTDNKITPNTIVEFKARSFVNVSFATNKITKYYWRIDYSTEDGRADFTATTTGETGELKNWVYGDALKFTDGVNKIYVTSEDSFGNKSNTISKDIIVGYNDPIINYVKEMNNKVINMGSIDTESSLGTALTFIADAVSKNPGGYVQKYDWYLNGVLAQSGASNRLDKNFTPGNYSVSVKIYDSIKGTAETSFTFAVNGIAAPTLTCTNATVNTNKMIEAVTSPLNLSFTATSAAKYDIYKYMWSVDGGAETELSVGTPLSSDFGVGVHTVTVYGVNTSGIETQRATFTFTIKQAVTSKDFAYTGGVQQYTIPVTGTYKLEVWGARGGNDGQSIGGYGGCATGNVTLNAGQIVYVYVGGKANDIPVNGSADSVGGWNGGGDGGYVDQWRYGSGGGGATDIRVGGTALGNRIIVAGGGGGADANDSEGSYSINGLPQQGGNGGGTNATVGNQGYNSGKSVDNGYATQTSGYSLGQGQGGDSCAAGGGGGYYGGKCADSAVSNSSGGSGYTGGVTNGTMQVGVNNGNGYAKITLINDSSLVAFINLSNEYFDGSTSYSRPGEMQNNFTITFDARPTVTTNLPTEGSYAYYRAGEKTYNYVVTDIHGGYLPVAGMGISLGTNGVAINAHSDNYYYSLLSYSATLTAKHDYKVVVNNRIPSLYIDGTLVKTGVTPVNCSTLISRPSVGVGGYGNYVGYANNFKFYNVAM